MKTQTWSSASVLPSKAITSAGPKLRGVHRRARQGDAHDVDERQGKPDHDTGEVTGLAVSGHTQDSQHEHAGEDHHLDEYGAEHADARAGGLAEPVAAQAGRSHPAEVGAVLDHEHERERGDDGSRKLTDPVADQAPNRQAPVDELAERHSRVDMAAGDVADGERHGDDRQAERERDAEVAERGTCDRGATAAEKHERERTERLRDVFLDRHRIQGVPPLPEPRPSRLKRAVLHQGAQRGATRSTAGPCTAPPRMDPVCKGRGRRSDPALENVWLSASDEGRRARRWPPRRHRGTAGPRRP